MGSHGKSRKVHLFPTFLKKLPAKSWAVMVSRAKSTEFRGQKGGYILTHNSVNIQNKINFSFLKCKKLSIFIESLRKKVQLIFRFWYVNMTVPLNIFTIRFQSLKKGTARLFLKPFFTVPERYNYKNFYEKKKSIISISRHCTPSWYLLS